MDIVRIRFIGAPLDGALARVLGMNGKLWQLRLENDEEVFSAPMWCQEASVQEHIDFLGPRVLGAGPFVAGRKGCILFGFEIDRKVYFRVAWDDRESTELRDTVPSVWCKPAHPLERLAGLG